MSGQTRGISPRVELHQNPTPAAAAWSDAGGSLRNQTDPGLRSEQPGCWF